MQKNTESISKSLKVLTLKRYDLYLTGVKNSVIHTLKLLNDVPAALTVLGKKEDGHYMYIFDILNHKNFTNIVETSELILKDIITSHLFQKIDFICFHSSIKFGSSNLKPNQTPEELIQEVNPKDLTRTGVLFKVEGTSDSIMKLIYIENEEIIEVDNDNERSSIRNIDKSGIPNLKKYLTRNNMTPTTTSKTNDIWSSLSIKKDQFDWIDNVITDSKKKQRSLTDTIKLVIRKVRNEEFDLKDSNSESSIECSSYELKLFLAGKIFEEKLRKQL